MKKKLIAGSFWAFAIMAVVIVVLGIATWMEHLYGSEFAYTAFYNSIWFTWLWILLATVACYYLIDTKLYKRIAVFSLHLAFLLILTGALITKLTGKNGHVHLREDQAVAYFVDENTHRMVHFPFILALKSFKIAYYPGTNSPADYISVVEVENAQGKSFEQEISMNHILQYNHFRFYQSSFDKDEKGSILSVSHDPWGISFSYVGYFLLFLSMLFILFNKKERFRFLLKKLAQKPAIIVLFVLIPALGHASPSFLLSKDATTISTEQAKKLGSLWVNYHGRICPVQTLANDFTLKLTGKNHYNHMSGEQVLFGWLFFPEQWQHIPMFTLRSEELKREINSSGQASFADFFDSQEQYKLVRYHPMIYGSGKLEGWIKEAAKLDEKIQLIGMLQSGQLMDVFPLNSLGQVQWYAPNSTLPEDVDNSYHLFVEHFFSMYYESLITGNAENANMFINKLSYLQQREAGEILPSDIHLQAERFYNHANVFYVLFMVCLTCGFIGLIYFIFSTLRNKSYPKAETVYYFLLCIVSLVIILGMALRAYIGGRLPLSNSYETLLVLACFTLLTGVLTRKYSMLITVFSFLLAGFTLLVAHIGSKSPLITPLVPVLQSPLLSIHVLVIMIAYGLCGFMTLNSLTSFTVYFFANRNVNKMVFIEKMKEISELFLYPATFLMGAGIFIGAIWANLSWGRYWGWDPKEVWALITFLLMGILFHRKTLKWFRKPILFHAYVFIVFLAVLMTYFGVNYILGGRHSYA
ncbi:Cytochrome c biogenesis protein CcsA [termite gut metagenome]|uniref:Cytochrome c biogenesis protein CcsA n=1 Tax=termite gut metagenome TaxID=433724 RepID=A0A5J4QP06_9ZZZZ